MTFTKYNSQIIIKTFKELKSDNAYIASIHFAKTWIKIEIHIRVVWKKSYRCFCNISPCCVLQYEIFFLAASLPGNVQLITWRLSCASIIFRQNIIRQVLMWLHDIHPEQLHNCSYWYIVSPHIHHNPSAFFALGQWGTQQIRNRLKIDSESSR